MLKLEEAKMIEIRKACVNDIPELTRLRVVFLNEVNASDGPPAGYEQNLSEYLTRSMADNSFAAWLAEEEGKIIATSGVCFYALAPNYSNPTSDVAYILNMFTLPEYRGRGLASELIRRLIGEAEERDCKRLALHATADGRRVYEKFGFESTDDEMVLTLP